MRESEFILAQPVDCAWAAGVIDGEGCIRLNATKNKSGRVSYTLRVSVANTDLRMLRRLIEIFGAGKIYPHKIYGTIQRRPHFDWVVYAVASERILKDVLPYLVIKREQAELALLARTLVRPRSRQPNPNYDELVAIDGQLRALKRGVAA